jgi:hypothetical protein
MNSYEQYEFYMKLNELDKKQKEQKEREEKKQKEREEKQRRKNTFLGKALRNREPWIDLLSGNYMRETPPRPKFSDHKPLE